MTETIPAVLTSRALGPVPSLMGEPTIGCRVDIANPDDGTPVHVGEVGEAVVGGEPGSTLFAGYLDDPQTTERAYRDGWFMTGDLARRAALGRFEFAGRRSAVSKVAGEKVSVVEVESVLGEHPAVLGLAVRSEERRVGKEGVSTCRSRGWP